MKLLITRYALYAVSIILIAISAVIMFKEMHIAVLVMMCTAAACAIAGIVVEKLSK